MKLLNNQVHLLLNSVKSKLSLIEKLKSEKDFIQHELVERNKELSCLYELFRTVQKYDKIEDFFKKSISLIQKSWQYPECTVVRVKFKDKVIKSDNFIESKWKQATAILARGKKIGSLEVFYTEEKPKAFEGPFLKEERNLINSISQQLAFIIEKKEFEQEHEEEITHYQQQLRNLAAQLAIEGEKERRNISNYLHDSICQDLAFTIMKLEVLKNDSKISSIEPSINEIMTIIENLLKKTRSLIFDLSPPILYELGLGAAIEWLAERYELKYKIKINFFNNTSKNFKLENELKIFIYQAVRELVINAAKHSKGKQIDINLNEYPKKVIFSVEDNGIGIKNLNSCFLPLVNDKFGLFNIRERVRLFLGNLDIQTKVNIGTKFSIEIPC